MAWKKTSKKRKPRKVVLPKVGATMPSSKAPTFHKSSKAKSRLNSRAKRVVGEKFRKIAVLIILALLASGIIYTSIRTVLSIKNKPAAEEIPEFTLEASGGDVIGFSGIPAFPGATFMYETHIKEARIQNFLASGKSAYVLPDNAAWEDAVAFYTEQLQALGWQHVLSVDFVDDTKEFGEYWVKGTDANTSTVGLRIYTKMDDLWYERITAADARTGLATEVAKEKEIELMTTMSSASELPESFPWSLKYPSLWRVEIKKSTLMEIEEADFLNVDTQGKLSIVPIDFVSMEDINEIGPRYIEQVNGFREQSSQLQVASKENVTIAGQSAVKYILEKASDDTITTSESSIIGYLCVIPNPKNQVVYAIATYDEELAMYNFVLQNIASR